MTDSDKVWQMLLDRGFIMPSAELYGGVSGFYDFGVLGAPLKNRFNELWRDYFLGLHPNFHEISGSIVLPEDVFHASGHLDHFDDPLVKCKDCGHTERADQILEEELEEKFEGMSNKELDQLIKEHDIDCERCGGRLGGAASQNLMFPVDIGVENVQKGYLRPETAQLPYLNFPRMFQATREQLPLGLAHIGKAFRNEISPRQGVYRLREFTQAELQIFFDPDRIDEHSDWDDIKDYELRLMFADDRDEVKEMTPEEVWEQHDIPKMYLYYLSRVQKFYLEELEVEPEDLRLYQLSEEERAFYNQYHWDVELDVDGFGGFGEVAGVHYRTDHDLKGHDEESGQELEVFDQEEEKRFIPHVMEVSFGVERTLYALLELAFSERDDKTVLRLPRELAPYSVAVFPLVTKDGLDEEAEAIYQDLRSDLQAFYDDSGSIGRRYARQDEIGTPFCVTIDYDTMDDGTVTIRERDSGEQIRVHRNELAGKLQGLISGEEDFEE